jgi:hypothetical protein
MGDKYDDETLLYITKKKAPKERERKKTRGKDQSLGKQQPKQGGPQEGKGMTKNRTFRQSHEAHQLKRGEVNSIKL